MTELVGKRIQQKVVKRKRLSNSGSIPSAWICTVVRRRDYFREQIIEPGYKDKRRSLHFRLDGAANRIMELEGMSLNSV